MTLPAPGINQENRLGIASWCLYDWANSAFPTIITTFIFSVYFTQVVAENPIAGAAQRSYAVSASAFVVAICAPLLGAIADNTGRRKPWLLLFTVLSLSATSALWWIKPPPAYALQAQILYAVAASAFGFAMVFHDAMLRSIAPPGYVGRVSGWGWSLGYTGGLSCLVIALFGFVQSDPPPVGLDVEESEHVRATSLLVVAWFGMFSIPVFLFTPDRPARNVSLAKAIRSGLFGLCETLRKILAHGPLARFLPAHMLYSNGLNTLFAFGGIFAAGSFGMSLREVLYFEICAEYHGRTRRSRLCLGGRHHRVQENDPDRPLWIKLSGPRPCPDPIGICLFHTRLRPRTVRRASASRRAVHDGKARTTRYRNRSLWPL